MPKLNARSGDKSTSSTADAVLSVYSKKSDDYLFSLRFYSDSKLRSSKALSLNHMAIQEPAEFLKVMKQVFTNKVDLRLTHPSDEITTEDLSGWKL